MAAHSCEFRCRLRRGELRSGSVPFHLDQHQVARRQDEYVRERGLRYVHDDDRSIVRDGVAPLAYLLREIRDGRLGC